MTRQDTPFVIGCEFAAIFASMTGGCSGTLDKLETFLANLAS
jgi:hypothetical protein